MFEKGGFAQPLHAKHSCLEVRIFRIFRFIPVIQHDARIRPVQGGVALTVLPILPTIAGPIQGCRVLASRGFWPHHISNRSFTRSKLVAYTVKVSVDSHLYGLSTSRFHAVQVSKHESLR